MNTFQKTALTTIAATLLLIAVGSLVRVSGAGLGCPDWPKCWGSWFPPASADDINRAYLAAQNLDIGDFNPTKMWTEYINRLIGVSIGFLILATFLRSLPYRTTRPSIFWASLVAVLLVGFQGWLGGQVVRSGLKPGMITLHMIAAVVLLALLIYAAFQTMKARFIVSLPPIIRRRITWIAGLVFALVCIQLLLGTQVRESIDPFIKDAGGMSRDAWLTTIGWNDHVHRSFTWPVLGLGLLQVYLVRKSARQGALKTGSLVVFGVALCQTGFGIALAYGGLPHVFQVLHLTFANILVCAAFWTLLIVRSRDPAAA